MKIERITSPHVPEPPPGRWSNALRVGDMLFISGMVSRAGDGRTIEGRDEYEQAKVIFGKIRSLVEAAGGAMADLVKVTIYVVNIKNIPKCGARGRSSLGGISHALRWLKSEALRLRRFSSRSKRLLVSAPGQGRSHIWSDRKTDPSAARRHSSFGGSNDKNRLFQKFAAKTENIMLPTAGCALVLAHALSSRLTERRG